MPDTVTITDTETGETEVSEVVTPRSKAELRAHLALGMAEVVWVPHFGEAYIDRLHRDEYGALIADVIAAGGEDNYEAPRGVDRVCVDIISFEELV